MSPEGEILLEGGTTVALLDVRLLGPDGAEAAVRREADAWLAGLADAAVAIRAAGLADRWGRVPAAIELEDGPGGLGRIDLADFLVGEGWARVDPGERDALCRPALLAIEAEARARRVGLWAGEPDPIPATDLTRLRAAAGRFAVVEGRVVGVGERAGRTYINFGRDYARDFAVVVPAAAWRRMTRAGLSAGGLAGRVVRVRGIVELRRGPVMEVASVDAVENASDGDGRSASREPGTR